MGRVGEVVPCKHREQQFDTQNPAASRIAWSWKPDWDDDAGIKE